MDDDQQFCLRWNNHQSTLVSVFDNLLENETLVDCTLAAEGKILKAHKVVLSACSPYFAKLLQEQFDKHPIFILKDVKYQELRAMMDYMYRGEVNISQDQLSALLKAAESLQIKGLSDNRSGVPKPAEQQQQQQLQQQQQQQQHRGLNMQAVVGKLSAGYTLEHTKRARVGHSAMESQEIGDSREGSSSPSRRRRKIRRRSIENAMTEVHDSNSSQMQANLQTNANLAGVGAITAAAASALAGQMPVSSAGVVAAAAAAVAGTSQQMTTSANKKTDSAKTLSETITNENQAGGSGVVTVGGVVAGAGIEQDIEHVAKDNKTNHKQKSTVAVKDASELVIEPKNEYDEEANEETVEDLTLDDEEMGIDDMDHNAGTSQGGEGSSQGAYAWPPHDRTQEDLMLAAQEGQQRDPQDLSQKLALLHKENKAPATKQQHIQKANEQSKLLLPVNKRARTNVQTDSAEPPTTTNVVQKIVIGQRRRQSTSEVSDLLYEFYKTNLAKAPKNQEQLNVKYRQSSPTSAETLEPSSIAAIATNGAAAGVVKHAKDTATASKNLQGDEMMLAAAATGNSNASFHPRIKFISKNNAVASANAHEANMPQLQVPITPKRTSIPTSVLVPTSPQVDIKPIINAETGLIMNTEALAASVIKPTSAVMAAFLADNMHKLRAQDIFQQQQHKTEPATPTKLLETFLRQQREQQQQAEEYDDSADNADDDEDDSRFNGFEDIHLMENAAAAAAQAKTAGGSQSFGNSSLTHFLHAANNSSTPNAAAAGNSSNASYFSDESKYMLVVRAQAQAEALRNLEFSLSDFGNPANDAMSSNHSYAARANAGSRNSNHGASMSVDGEAIYECRHCGKKYRWKSTLRRHENVECGGKEPSHQCPYCPYKSKQRGNLGVHVRKHHANLPQLASKRRSKYSANFESGSNSAHGSDDSSSKLIIDCSK